MRLYQKFALALAEAAAVDDEASVMFADEELSGIPAPNQKIAGLTLRCAKAIESCPLLENPAIASPERTSDFAPFSAWNSPNHPLNCRLKALRDRAADLVAKAIRVEEAKAAAVVPNPLAEGELESLDQELHRLAVTIRQIEEEILNGPKQEGYKVRHPERQPSQVPFYDPHDPRSSEGQRRAKIGSVFGGPDGSGSQGDDSHLRARGKDGQPNPNPTPRGNTGLTAPRKKFWAKLLGLGDVGSE